MNKTLTFHPRDQSLIDRKTNSGDFLKPKNWLANESPLDFPFFNNRMWKTVVFGPTFGAALLKEGAAGEKNPDDRPGTVFVWSSAMGISTPAPVRGTGELEKNGCTGFVDVQC